MSFCPKCGAALKVATAAPEAPVTRQPREYRRNEKGEKSEKGEKGEKGEKHEKSGGGVFIGPLIAGIVLIFFGIIAYVQTLNIVTAEWVGPVIIIIIGLAVIIGGIYAATMARRRHPQT